MVLLGFVEVRRNLWPNDLPVNERKARTLNKWSEFFAKLLTVEPIVDILPNATFGGLNVDHVSPPSLNDGTKFFTRGSELLEFPVLVHLRPRVPDVEPNEKVVVGVVFVIGFPGRRALDILLDVIQPVVVISARDGQVVMTTIRTIVARTLLAIPFDWNISAREGPNTLLQAFEQADPPSS